MRRRGAEEKGEWIMVKFTANFGQKGQVKLLYWPCLWPIRVSSWEFFLRHGEIFGCISCIFQPSQKSILVNFFSVEVIKISASHQPAECQIPFKDLENLKLLLNCTVSEING